jgi:hypothetical protein
MPQTLLLSTTDRNCRPTWHKFQPQGGKEYIIHSTHTQYTHLAGPFWVLWQNPRPFAPNQEKPHTTPYHSLIYISRYISLDSPGCASCRVSAWRSRSRWRPPRCWRSWGTSPPSDPTTRQNSWSLAPRIAIPRCKQNGRIFFPLYDMAGFCGDTIMACTLGYSNYDGFF